MLPKIKPLHVYSIMCLIGHLHYDVLIQIFSKGLKNYNRQENRFYIQFRNCL